MNDNKSVDRILRILELISKHPNGLTLSEIYKELEIPKSTAFDFLQALYKADAVYYKDEISKRYVIGSKIYAIGQAYTKNSSLINVCKPIIRNICKQYGNLLIITKRVGNNIVYVHKYESDDSKIATFEIGGSISSFYATSIGKCYLAFDKYMKNFVVNDFELLTPYTVVRKEELENQISSAIKKGYAEEYKEEDINYKSLSFPIYNFESRCCGALTYKAPVEFEFTEDLINDLLKASRTISMRLGYKK